MTSLVKFGEFEVVRLDSARHRHRGVKQFAVRDSKRNYSGYSRSEQEATDKARELDQRSKEQCHEASDV